MFALEIPLVIVLNKGVHYLFQEFIFWFGLDDGTLLVNPSAPVLILKGVRG